MVHIVNPQPLKQKRFYTGEEIPACYYRVWMCFLADLWINLFCILFGTDMQDI